MKHIKASILLMILIALTQGASAVTVIDIPKTLDEYTYVRENLIDTELHTDPSNGITELKTTQYAISTGNATLGFYFGNDTGNDTEFKVQIVKNTWVIFNYYVLTATLTSNNYTIFSYNRTDTGLDSSYITEIKYDSVSGNTTFIAAKGILMTKLEWNGIVNTMPATTIRIRSDAPYKIEAKIINIEEFKARQEKIGSLNPFLGWLANTLKGVLPSYVFDGLLMILILINIFFTIGSIMISSLFYRPYLIFVWFLSAANIYTSLKTNTYSEFIAEYTKVLAYGFGALITLILWISRISIEFVKLVRQIFQI